MPTYYCHPSLVRGEFDKQHGGIRGALEAHTRLLPSFGWTEVHDEADADVVVGYLSTKSKRLDVFHLRGLYPTAEIDMVRGYWRYNAKIIENIRRAERVCCVSEWVADILRRDMHAQPDVVPGHGFDLDAWDRIEDWNGPGGRPYALWNKTRRAGVCDPQPVLELARRFPEYQFITTFLPGRINPPSNVIVTDTLDYPDAWKLVKNASIYLATTKETFGRSTLEAMASGCGIVGFDWGATPSVLDDCGILVPPGDYDALADAFVEVQEHGHVYGGRERVRTHFRWEDVVGQVAEVYQKALDSRSHRSPVVSVIIPVYNYARYVATAIRSVLQQQYGDYELIVVDDGSTDGSAEVVANAIENVPNARLMKQANAGVAYARNTGIRTARGKYICCLDADDAVAPSFLGALVPALDADRSLGIVYTGLSLMREDDSVSQSIHPFPKSYDADAMLAGKPQIPTCCLFRRLWWERLGGYRQRYAPYGAGQEDADFWFRILAHGGGAEKVTDAPLFYYRRHREQSTRVHDDKSYKDRYRQWHPFVADGQHPLASQIGTPERGSWPVRNYDTPAVSIVIPVGPGHEPFLTSALDSVEAQTFRNWEVIVVNDTGNPIDLTAWPFVKYVETGRQPSDEHSGGYARNRGTEIATAPLVVYLDADDYLQPRFLGVTTDAHRETGRWIYTDVFTYRGDGSVNEYKCSDWNVHTLHHSGIATVTCLYTKMMWETVGGFSEILKARDDYDFHLRLARGGFCGVHVDEPLVTYRQHTGSLRRRGSRDKMAAVVRAMYDREELEMACAGCGKGRTKRDATGVVMGFVTKAEAGYIELQFTGRNTNDLTFTGKTGRKYRAGNNSFNRFISVHPDDVQTLMRKRCFKRANRSQGRILVAEPTPVDVIDAITTTVKNESDGRVDIATLPLVAIRELDFTQLDITALVAMERAREPSRSTVLSFLQRQVNKARRAARRA